MRKPACSNIAGRKNRTREEIPLPLLPCPQISHRAPYWLPSTKSWRSRETTDNPWKTASWVCSSRRRCREGPKGHVNNADGIRAEDLRRIQSSEAGTILGASVSHWKVKVSPAFPLCCPWQRPTPQTEHLAGGTSVRPSAGEAGGPQQVANPGHRTNTGRGFSRKAGQAGGAGPLGLFVKFRPPSSELSKSRGWHLTCSSSPWWINIKHSTTDKTK